MVDYFYTGTSAATNAWANWTGNEIITSGGAWYNWSVASNGTSAVIHGPNYYSTDSPVRTPTPAPRLISAEEIAAAHARQQALADEQKRAHERYQREQRRAPRRAKVLLLRHLTPAQREDFKRSLSFRVISEDGERTYEVRHGSQGNVKLIRPDGTVARSYCIHPYLGLPVEDIMLAQKLLLEADEERFLAVANAS